MEGTSPPEVQDHADAPTWMQLKEIAGHADSYAAGDSDEVMGRRVNRSIFGHVFMVALNPEHEPRDSATFVIPDLLPRMGGPGSRNFLHAAISV